MSKLKEYIVKLLGDIPKKDLIADNAIDMLKNIPGHEQPGAIITMIEIAKAKSGK